MPLFQHSVINKYLQESDPKVLNVAFDKFQKHFGDPERQKNIRELKEEQYQEGFLRELFVNILGYTINPEPNYNLLTEQKNEKDSKKADGAILLNNGLEPIVSDRQPIVIGVIELKGTDTTDLSKVEVQAFGYKNNQKDCKYVITSNFEKLRFYINNAIDFEEFNLFNLSRERFNLLYLCLAKDNLLNGIPQKIKEASISQEENITKKLYSDYSAFKRYLFQNICSLNPGYDKLTLFKKTQKLLDRFLFILFGEDRLLLPPNSIKVIINQWEQYKDLDDYKPLYDRFKKYFSYMNVGYKGKQYEVFAYNGGLFTTDEILDNIRIDDAVLYEHTIKLSNYDFDTEVDVNILGHIFEHSLNEIEEIQAEIEGKEVDKSKSKRKKDGIFYTPKYITKYIVENTVGALCSEKKKELGIEVEEVIIAKRKDKKKELLEKIDTYRDWLLKLTICDPACGSGAFLNQALDFLITEHRKLDELKARITNSPMILSDIENSILENNIFGVDLNDEAVEIAKLSLWLKTAQKGRKLSNLNSNIKCGNSLIDDPQVAGDKAFSWQNEFPEIFSNGGFDVVIGNPPYVNANEIKKNSSNEVYNFLKSKYKIAKGTVDLYIYFFEKGLEITKRKGLLSYITPNRYLSASYGKAFREILLNQYKLFSLIDYSDTNVFSDASTYPVITFIENDCTKENYELLTGRFNDKTKELISSYYPSDNLNILDDSILGFLLNNKISLTRKVFSQSVPLDKCGQINATSTASEADMYSDLINENSGYKLINTGTIDPYYSSWGIDYLTDKGKKYLNPYLQKDSNIISDNRHKLYNSKKIIISKIGLKCEAFYDKNGEFASINTNCIYNFFDSFLPEYVLCWLNSKLYKYTFECLFDGLRMSGGYLLFSAPNLRNTKIKNIPISEQQPFINKAEIMLSKNKELSELKTKFLKLLTSKYTELKITIKIESWSSLDFSEFSKELQKQKIKLSLSEQAEWMEYFEKEKAKATSLHSEISKTDHEIDQMVYALYGLTDEEMKIIENES